MPIITCRSPSDWRDLEEIVESILQEAGMNARRNVRLELPRGNVDVDVYAEEQVDGIVHRIICECKHWSSAVPKGVVHAFRTVMAETGANRGYIISRSGFQSGAIEAAQATNIELVNFEEFQEIYFSKWIRNRIWSIEHSIKGFNTYYEPLGKPGYSKLESSDDRAAYDSVWERFFSTGMMLVPFSPYIRMVGDSPYPDLPFDCSEFEERGIPVPDDLRELGGYREFLTSLEGYALEGLRELRKVNPITKDKLGSEIVSDD